MYYGHLACLHEISIGIVSFSLPLFNYIILTIRIIAQTGIAASFDAQ